MKDEFLVYYHSISLSQILIDRVNDFYNVYLKLCPEEIIGTFITDFIKEDGSREFESLWFFSQHYMMEAKNFLSEQSIDIAPFSEIDRIEYSYRDYDFNRANDNSRLSIHFSLKINISGTLKATKNNCDFLLEIYNRYIRQNL